MTILQIAILGAGIFVKTQYYPRLSEISDIVSVKFIWSPSEEFAKSAVEIARKHFGGLEAVWGNQRLDRSINEGSCLGVAVVRARQFQCDHINWTNHAYRYCSTKEGVIVRARVYVKKKRSGRRMKPMVQTVKLTEDTSDSNGKEQVMGIEGSNPKAAGENANNNISMQTKGAPGGSLPVVERTSDMQQNFRDMLGKMETVITLDAELAIEDWVCDSEKTRNRKLGRMEDNFGEKEDRE